MRIQWLVVLLGLASCQALPAQETRGSIQGRVTDTSGAVIPGTVVHATNKATNVTVSTRSNAEGNYGIPYLVSGIYVLKAEVGGFKTFIRDNIEIRIDDRLNIPIQLQIGELAEVLTVTAETPLLDSTNASMGQVIDQRRIAELPIAHGNPYLLMQLSAGVVYTQNAGLDRPFEPTHIVGYSMDGVKANKSEITMDGVQNSTVKRGTTDTIAGYTPPADIVQEFKIQTMPFDASVGHTQGGVTSITLKSGGNQLHGTAYWGVLDPSLNANLFFANKAGQPRGEFDYNRWGGSLTGPVYIPKVYNGKDRTFFTYGYEGIHESRPMGSAYGTGTLTVPTAAQREGDFSALLKLGSQYQVYDPATRKQAPNGRTVVDPLPGNIVPSSRISPIAKSILNYWSLPNAPGTADGLNNLIRVNDPEAITYYNHISRVDHAFNDKHRMFARVNTYRRFSYSSDWFRSAATGTDSEWKQHAASLDHVYQINPTTLLNLRAGYFRLQIQQTPLNEKGFDLASLGFPPIYTDAIDRSYSAFPYITITGYTATPNTWFRDPMANASLEAHLTAVRGNHTLRFGGDGRQYRTNHYVWNRASTGRFNFDNTWTRGPFDNSPVAPIGQAAAALMLGLPSGGYVERNASFAEQSTVWSLYMQDDWRVTPSLTINAGLRYEIEGPLTERWDRSIRGYDFDTPNPLNDVVRANYARNPIAELPPEQFRLMGGVTFAGVNGQPRTLFTRDKNNIMPRIGFAYQIGPRTVLRGGYGVYFGQLGLQRGDVKQEGFSYATNLVPSLDSGLTFVATLANPYPTGIEDPRGAADGLMTFTGRAITFFDENPEASRQQRWQLSIQRELPQRVLLELGYVGNHASSIQTTRDLRGLPLQYLSTSPYRDTAHINWLSQQVPNPFAGLLPGTGLNGANTSRSYLLSSGDYPHFTDISTTQYDGYSWYHALQVRTERRFASGWTVTANYLWSKNMEALSRLNGPYSPLEYVVSDQDRPHRVVVSAIWELPFGRGKRYLSSMPGVVDKFFGGWQVQGIYTAQSGQAIGFGNALFIGDIHDITLPKSERKPERWFNTDAGFERASNMQLGNNYRLMPSRFNDVRTDGINSFDLSALKNTRIGERFNVQFRGEFLNAFNHTLFAEPNTTPTSSAFGQVTAQRGYPRRIQLGLKFLF
ncbi:MAG TPA: TonB-dependent receptor [Bryobacteraceae bacterium]|nr:TonB-dependent receptor [Bryobacteraceae bacterium]